MRAILAVLTLLLLLAPGAFADTRIFHLKHRPAADIAETVRGVLGDDARVAAADHSLFINAPPSELSAVAELIGILDHPPTMLRVSVIQSREIAAGEMNIDTSGNVSIGSSTVIIGRPDARSHGGVYGNHDRLRIDASSSRYRENRHAEQFVVTLEGRPARISVGRSIPFVERWLLLARRHAHVVETIHYESVDTGFEVIPELFGSLVQLDIHPFMAFQDPDRPYEILFQELTTTVRVPLGQWYDLGGTLAGHDEVSREILSGGIRTEEGSGIVRIKVELQPN